MKFLKFGYSLNYLVFMLCLYIFFVLLITYYRLMSESHIVSDTVLFGFDVRNRLGLMMKRRIIVVVVIVIVTRVVGATINWTYCMMVDMMCGWWWWR